MDGTISVEMFEHKERGFIYRITLQLGKQRLTRLANKWDEVMKAVSEIGRHSGIEDFTYEGKRVKC